MPDEGQNRGLIHRIASIAERYPERNALFAGGEHHTYRQLIGLATDIQLRIVDAGLGDDERIGVLTGDDVHTYASILAILANGSAYVPINHRNPAQRNASIIGQAGLRSVLSSRDDATLDPVLPLVGADLTILATQESAVAAGKLPLPDTRPDDLAYLFFTSGSTGEPKGVPIYHRNIDSFMSLMLDGALYDFSSDDRFLQMFELTFDLSVMSLFTPLCLGACCYVVPEKGVLYLSIMQILETHGITVALMVPSVLSYLSRYFSEIRLESLRHSLFCGEALPQKLVEGWNDCLPNAAIQNVYGPTEATIYCLTYDWNSEDSHTEAENGVVAIGVPMPGMQAYVIDDQRRLVPQGQRGELCLHGSQVTDRYWNNEATTNKAFVDIEGLDLAAKVYRTGDVCFINDKGNFVYCGRTDSQIKIDGHRIELGEIEHHAREFTGQALVAAVTTAGAGGSPTLVLVVEEGTASAEALTEHLKTKVPAYMVPRKISFVEQMPLNLNGKIDRKALQRSLA